ncbi:hypothetical protein C2845_PM15G08340 [Panicum miliaceum]|uniref:Cellulose synthase-like protein H1 n=1 Tax=Panicum miliaceum TaxID=4540 RepID=A0A3L6Q8N9_PANMI|nr:hypothetical protein C2845_PM15G08340 [Panicum miliaceum]
MASATKLLLQERVPLARTAWKLADLAVLSLLLALLARRAATLLAAGGAGSAAPACTWCWLERTDRIREEHHVRRDVRRSASGRSIEPHRCGERSLLLQLRGRLKLGPGAQHHLCRFSYREAAGIFVLQVPLQCLTMSLQVGWVYGSMTEDILTGQRIHAAGWRSALLNTDPPAFLGGAPTGGPASLTQYKRWATGLLEIIFSRNNPILQCISRRLELRQCLAYLVIDVWPLRAPFELCYALLGPYCLLANRSFLPKVSEPGFIIPVALFLTYNLYNLAEYMECRLSARAWWNNHRMQRIVSSSAWLLAFLTVVLKTLGLSETVFEVTRKEQGQGAAPDDDGADPGRFTFDSSLVFVPPTTLTILTAIALAVGAWRAVTGAAPAAGGGPGAGEFACCGWLVLCFWPFVRGLAGKGSYGIPWSVKIKAGLPVAAFVHFCTRN